MSRIKNIDYLYKYSEEEKGQLGIELVEEIDEQVSILAEAKVEAARYKQLVAKQQAMIDDISEKIRNGFTTLNADCKVVIYENEEYEGSKGVAKYYKIDDENPEGGEIVYQESLVDYQMHLDDTVISGGLGEGQEPEEDVEFEEEEEEQPEEGDPEEGEE